MKNRWSLVALPALALGVLAFARPALPVAVTHHVQMMQQGSKYMFSPANFTVHVGDVVEFDKDHIPAGAREVLNHAMPRKMGDLAGPFLTQPHEKYSVSFAGAPKGEYHYFCLPHKALGMVGVITVE